MHKKVETAEQKVYAKGKQASEQGSKLTGLPQSSEIFPTFSAPITMLLVHFLTSTHSFIHAIQSLGGDSIQSVPS